MKQKVKNLFQVSLFLLLNINYAYSSGAKLPDIATTSDGGSTQLPTTMLTGGPYVDQIKTMASNSDCANTSWASRGRAPIGYIKGVTLSYARSLCRLKEKSNFET